MDNKQEENKNNFRLRGIETTRLDTLVDAAFAFGATVLLISSGKLPSNYAELLTLIKDIPSFVLSFFTMMIFWLSHRVWSRRYGLENFATITLTLSLVVTLLVYIYPLKLMYSSMLSFMSNGFLPIGIQIQSALEGVRMIGFYGLGFSALSVIMMGLFFTCWRKRTELALNFNEKLETRLSLNLWITLALAGLISAFWALVMPVKYAVWAGTIYMLLGPGIPLLMWNTRKKWDQKQKESLAEND